MFAPLALTVLLAASTAGVDTAVRHLEHGSAEQKEKAKNELLALGPSIALELVKAARKATPQGQEAILQTVAKLGPEALEPLSRCQLSSPLFGPSECDLATKAVARMGAEALLVLEEWAKEGGGSQLQLRDVAGILRLREHDLDFAYIERWVANLGLDELWRTARGDAPTRR